MKTLFPCNQIIWKFKKLAHFIYSFFYFYSLQLYKKRNTLAVDGLTFGVKEGEVIF